MFGWLKRTPPAGFNETIKVWVSCAWRDAGASTEIGEVLLDGGRVVAVHHFADVLVALEAALRERSVPFVQAEYGGDVMGMIGESAEAAVVVAAEKLRPADRAPQRRDATRPLTIVVLGMHPTRRGEELVDRFAEGVPFPAHVVRHVALDEPAMKVLAGERILKLMKALGMRESEPINDSSVAAAVRNAQVQVQKRATGDRPARSAEEWLRLNLPQP